MSQFDQLKMYYTQLLNIALEIKELINNENYNDAMTKLTYREGILRQDRIMKRYVKFNDEQKKEIDDIVEKLKELEESNIYRLQSEKAQVQKELLLASQTAKLKTLYDPMGGNESQIIDTKDIEDS